MHGQRNIKPCKYKFTTKSVFVFFFVRGIGVAVLLFTAKITLLYALFLSVYKITELKGKFGLAVSSPKLFAVFSQTAVILGVRAIGIQKYWVSGLEVYKNTGCPGYRYTKILGVRARGIQKYWVSGLEVYKNTGCPG